MALSSERRIILFFLGFILFPFANDVRYTIIAMTCLYFANSVIFSKDARRTAKLVRLRYFYSYFEHIFADILLFSLRFWGGDV